MGLNPEDVLRCLEDTFPGMFALRGEGPGRFCLLAGDREFRFHSLPRSVGDENLLLEAIPGQAKAEETPASAAPAEGLTRVHIWEDQWIFHRAAVLSRMAALLGRCQRVHGRETFVRRVGAQAGYDFLKAHHLLVPLSGKYRFGLYYRNELRSLAVFSGARRMESRGGGHRSFELLRFCHSSRQLVTGGLSKLLAAFVTAFRPGDIMTYIDLEWSAGKSFLKNGFTLAGSTPPQVFWIRPEEGVRYYPRRLPPGLQGAGPDEMHRRGYYRIYNHGSLKLIRYL